MSTIHRDRIEELRAAMREAGIDFYMIPTGDFHNSEYVAEYFRTREFFSGFTGSAGTLVVSMEEAYLWTDGRYFIQAAGELEGSGIGLMKMSEPGVPTIREFLGQKMGEGSVLGFDGRCVSCKEGRALEETVRGAKGALRTDVDLADGIWKDRPALPCHPVIVLSDEYTGEDIESKLSRLREKAEEFGCVSYIDSKLDCIMWLLNLRGEDVECNPVALSHLLVDQTNVYLFIQEGEITGELRAYAALHRISLLPYDDFEDFLGICDHRGDLMCDPSSISYSVYLAAKKGTANATCRLKEEGSPLEEFKCVKNDVEMANIRNCYRMDSAALCRFIKWVTERVNDHSQGPVTEALWPTGL